MRDFAVVDPLQQHLQVKAKDVMALQDRPQHITDEQQSTLRSECTVQKRLLTVQYSAVSVLYRGASIQYSTGSVLYCTVQSRLHTVQYSECTVLYRGASIQTTRGCCVLTEPEVSDVWGWFWGAVISLGLVLGGSD